MFKNKLTTKNAILLLWFPLITLLFSIYFLFQDLYTVVIGILILGQAIESLVDLKLKGLDDYQDERYLLIKQKGNQFAYLMIISVIIVLAYIHFFHITLEAGFVLVLLLIIAYASSTLSSLYLSFKY